MMTSKASTQGWSKSVQSHDYGDDHQRRFSSATPEGGDGKEQNVGAVLNQIANPTGKDAGHQVRKNHNNLDKDDFLKLMLTQMKNQDPMNPMQSHEMAAQLAQFTSLEQLFNVNKNLEALSVKQDPLTKFEALNFLGKSIKSDTREILHTAGDSANELRFNLGQDAAKVKIKIGDEFGQPIKELDVANLDKGLAKIVWNGTDSRDREVKAGKYTFTVEALNSAGAKIAVQTETVGVVTGVNYTTEGPVLMVGDQKVKLADVHRIEDGHLKELQNSQEGHVKQAIPIPVEGESAAPQIPPADLAALASQFNLGSGAGAGSSKMEEYQKALIKTKPEERPGVKMGDVGMPVEATNTGGTPTIAANDSGGSGKKLGGAFGRRY